MSFLQHPEENRQAQLGVLLQTLAPVLGEQLTGSAVSFQGFLGVGVLRQLGLAAHEGTILLQLLLCLTSLVAHCLFQHLHIFKLRPICLHCDRNAHGAGLTIHCILQCKVWSHCPLGAGSALRALILHGLLAH